MMAGEEGVSDSAGNRDIAEDGAFPGDRGDEALDGFSQPTVAVHWLFRGVHL